MMRDVAGEDTCVRCQKCEKWRHAPEFVREPMLLWDRFPCPPPGTPKTKLLLELDWTGQMGPRDGCEALRRVATRCHVDLTNTGMPQSLVDCDYLFNGFSICGTTQCVIAIILAFIFLLFLFILVIVCRYVRRNEKESSPTCGKVLSTDQTHLNTHVNRYYVQSQYIYRAGNIPDRRGLPYEARATENGVEARLIKAIQNAPMQAYPFDEFCSQCMNTSRQSTLSGRSRQGYERIYWKDQPCLQKRVPSNDSLFHRKQLDRHRSTAGSSSDMSHFYEYISDTPYDTWTSRRSNHSNIFFPRNSSITFRDADSKYSDEEHGLIHNRAVNREMDYFDGTRTDMVPVRAVDSSRENSYKDDRNPYHSSLSDTYSYSENGYDPKIIPEEVKRYAVPDIPNNIKADNCKPLSADVRKRNDIIKGYKYTFNPSYDDDNTATTLSRPEYYEDSTSPETPSEIIEFEEFSRPNDVRQNSLLSSNSPNNKRFRQRPNRSPGSRSNRNSDSTSLSDNSSKSNSISIPRTNGSFLKGGK